jgi:hypothetical protein
VYDNLWTAAIIAAGILLVRLALNGFRRRGDRQADVDASTSPLPRSAGRRPLGITILAGIYFASGAWTVLVLLLNRAVPSLLRGILHATLGAPVISDGLLAGLLAIGRIPLIALGALTAMSLIAGRTVVVTASFLASIGYGLWRRQNWARIVTIVLTGWTLASALFSVPRLNISTQTTWLAWAGLCACVLGYLFTPAVRTAFRSTSCPTAASETQTA